MSAESAWSENQREIRELKSEIERLKSDIKLSDELMVSRAKHFDETVAIKKHLITELCDALNLANCEGYDYSPLIHRAREATR